MLKEKLNNTACLFVQVALDGTDTWRRYDPLTYDAISSFKTFHPDVDIHLITNDNIHDYIDHLESITNTKIDIYDQAGIFKFIMGHRFMTGYNYTKLIMLGVDTITCGRLNEFINDSTPILASLNYPCQEETDYVKTPVVQFKHNGQIYTDHGNINADVVCFNDANALEKIIKLSIEHYSYFAEQGALNEFAWANREPTIKIVDFPYPISSVVYNARSKGVFGTDMIKSGKLCKHGPPYDGLPAPTTRFKVSNDKLYTDDDKEIKVFHYVEGLGGRPLDSFLSTVDDFKTWFNTETISYFRKIGCRLFDNKLTN
jgi:hypothetical protein